MNEADSLYKAVILPWHTTALLRETPYSASQVQEEVEKASNSRQTPVLSGFPICLFCGDIRMIIVWMGVHFRALDIQQSVYPV